MIVDRNRAMGAQIRHSFIPLVGYVAHGEEPPVNNIGLSTTACDPPHDIKDGDHCLLRSAAGIVVEMTWVGAERAWAPLNIAQGNRLAWTAEHLSRAGWKFSMRKLT